jgi:hypothetical protein
MTDTVEVVAARPLNLPAGRLAEDDLFPTTTAHATILAGMEMLKLAEDKGGKMSLLDRAVAVGKAARKDLDARLAKEASDAADAEAKAASKAAKTDKEA